MSSHPPAVQHEADLLDISDEYPSTPRSTFYFPRPDCSPDSDDGLTAHQTTTYRPTPPAALSSLGLRSKMTSKISRIDSEESFNDEQYDMIDADDLSDVSGTDHETASIGSDDEESVDVGRETRPVKTAKDWDQELAENCLLEESIASDNLETPRGSVMGPIFTSTILKHETGESVDADADADADAAAPPRALPAVSKPDKLADILVSSFKYLPNVITVVAFLVVTNLVLSFVLPALKASSTNSLSILEARRHELVAAIADVSGSKIQLEEHQVHHLLPENMAKCFSTDTFGLQTVNKTFSDTQPTNCATYSAFDVFAPNYFFVSLPGISRFPKVTSSRVVAANRDLDFEMKEIIKGVHLINFSRTNELVQVNVQTTDPLMNITFASIYHNGDLQHLIRYEKAELSKIMGQELSNMRGAAKGITDKLSEELTAGSKATQKTAISLSNTFAREITVWGNHAVAIVDKTIQAGNTTAARISKDFVLVQQDVAKFTKDVATRMQDGVLAVKDCTAEKLAKSRERLQDLRKILKQRRANRKAEKELRKTEKKSRKADGLNERARRNVGKMERTVEHKVERKERRAARRADD